MYASELIVRLADSGVEQTVLIPEHSRAYDFLKSHKVKIHTYDVTLRGKIRLGRFIASELKRTKFDIVHAHTRVDLWGAAIALVGKDRPKLIYSLYMNAVPKQDLVHRWLFSKIHRLLSSSQIVLESAKQNFPIDEASLQLMRYGRATEIYKSNAQRRQELRKQNGTSDDALVFLSLSRIDEGKGLREIVDGFVRFLRNNPDSKNELWIVGDRTILHKHQDGKIEYESQSERLYNWIKAEAQSEDARGKIKIFPFQKNYVEWIDASDVFCMASHNETYSLSVLDAMMMGKPVIGTNSGGTPEQVVHLVRGFLVEPKSSLKLSDAYQFFTDHKEKRSSLGEAAKSWALSEHSWEKTLKEMISLYEKS